MEEEEKIDMVLDQNDQNREFILQEHCHEQNFNIRDKNDVEPRPGAHIN